MKIEEIIKSINQEVKKTNDLLYSKDGLLRLQEVASQYNGEYKLIWSDVLLEEIKKRPKQNLYKTNLESFDNLIGGFKEQQLVTLTASTKHGKTAFSLFLVERLESLSPLVIPLEQSNEELVEQRFSNGYSIPRFLSPEKLAARVTVDWIEQRIVEGIAKYNTRLVVIDHLGYIDDFGEDNRFRRENLAYRIGQIMKGLKNIAKKWNVIIVLLAHISQHNESNPPSLEDIKNSSDIIQESDIVMMLWRKNEVRNKVRIYENKTMVSVMANRRTGRNGNIGLSFNTKTGSYEEDNAWVEKMEQDAHSDKDFDDF